MLSKLSSSFENSNLEICVYVSPSVVLTLFDSMEEPTRLLSIHGILQARILKWVAITFSRGSSEPRDQTQVSYIAARFFTI